MKKIVTICCLLLALISNLKAESQQLNLTDFSIYAAEQNNVNILIDDSLSNKSFIFTISGKEDLYLEAFEKALNIHNLELVKNNGLYYVRDVKTYEEKPKYRAIKLNFINYEDIKNFLQVYKDTKFEFISTSKLLMVYSNEMEFESIKNTIEQIDSLPESLKLKITILDTNLNKLREYGSNNSILNLTNDTNFFFNLIAYPFSTTNQIPMDQRKGFYSFLKFVNDDGISEFLSNPIFTITHNEPIDFSMGREIPYKKTNSSIENTEYRTMNSYEFKDVGLKISLKPIFLNDGMVKISIKIDMSTLESFNKDEVPLTSKKFFEQSFNMSKDSIFVLTGINEKQINKYESGVPVLKDIPLTGWLFKYETTKTTFSNLSIFFELIEDYQAPQKFIDKISNWEID